ncbi:MAG TPA: hypothetical protein VFC53_03525 [Dehalococcoidia bacterium]|nr:hypothetical protein [Dehalococcoidia bacterium]
MLEPLEGKPVRFPPGRVSVRLDERYRLPYRRLYRRYRTILTDMPVLRDRDFDGRPVKLTPRQLAALNQALLSVNGTAGAVATVFDAQEREKTRLFKRTQFLS